MTRVLRLQTRQGQLTCDALQKLVGINGLEHIQRFVVMPSPDQDTDEITVTLYRVSGRRIDDLVEQLRKHSGVISVSAD
jgi:hypothetical protein